jgi:hypothetical protein
MKFLILMVLFALNARANELQPWQDLKGTYHVREINGQKANCEEVQGSYSMCLSKVSEGYSYGIVDENGNDIKGIMFDLLQSYGRISSWHIRLPIPENLGTTQAFEDKLVYEYQGKLGFPCVLGSTEVKVHVTVHFLNKEKTLFKYEGEIHSPNNPNSNACYNSKFSTVLERVQ